MTRVEQVVVRPETHYLDPLVCTTRDGVRNVFRDVQVITSVAKEQVVPLVREFGVHMKEILVYERVTEMIQVFSLCENTRVEVTFAISSPLLPLFSFSAPTTRSTRSTTSTFLYVFFHPRR